jgi:hypothetical protein
MSKVFYRLNLVNSDSSWQRRLTRPPMTRCTFEWRPCNLCKRWDDNPDFAGRFTDCRGRTFETQKARTRFVVFGRSSAGLDALAASTIDAPEVYEGWPRRIRNAIRGFHSFCGKGCGKPCAKLERARQMRASERFAQLCGRIDLTTVFNRVIGNQTHP